MTDDVMRQEYPEREQRWAVCISQLDEGADAENADPEGDQGAA